MDPLLLEEMKDQEKNHWWFVARRRIIRDVLQRIMSARCGKILDIGCGTGYNFQWLAAMGREVSGIEQAESMVACAQEISESSAIVLGTFPDVSLDETYDLVTLFDVLEHIENETGAFQKVRTLLNPGGLVCLTVPAFNFLWSGHDELAGHKRRYRGAVLEQSLRRADFTVVRLTYFNAFLFAPIASVRILGRLFAQKKRRSDFSATPRFLNHILAAIFGSERFLLRLMDVPFGVSILVIAQKNP